jgi:hypothetical protein
VPELTLGHPEEVFNPGADTGLDLLQLLLQAPDRCRLAQNLALARLHGQVQGHRLGCVRQLVGALVAGIGNTSVYCPGSTQLPSTTSLTLAAVPRTVCTRPE